MSFDVIDFHTHPFYESKNNFCFFDGIVNDYNEFKDDLINSGISKCCGSVIRRFVPKDFSEISELNEEAFKLSQIYNGFYIPGIHFHPEFIEQSLEEMRKYAKLGVKLIGEICPYLMGWTDYYTEEIDALYREADKLNMVISFHSNVSGGLEQTIEKAVEKYPNLTFVAAHPREKKLLENHIERLKKYDNYFLDLSGTGISRFGTIKHLVNSVGSEKILFGTDYPISNPKMYVEGVLFEKITDKEKEDILSANAKRILGL